MLSNMCDEAGITGNGIRDHLSNHCLRDTMITLLIEAGHNTEDVQLRTYHKDPQSVISYIGPHGAEGLRQQVYIYEGNSESSKRILSIENHVDKPTKVPRIDVNSPKSSPSSPRKHSLTR